MSSTYLNLNVHVVFATKERAPSIVEPWRADFHAYTGGVIRGLGAEPLAIGGMSDHVHILTRVRATHAVADLVREIKKATGAWASGRWREFAWQTGYAAFSVSYREIPSVAKSRRRNSITRSGVLMMSCAVSLRKMAWNTIHAILNEILAPHWGARCLCYQHPGSTTTGLRIFDASGVDPSALKVDDLELLRDKNSPEAVLRGWRADRSAHSKAARGGDLHPPAPLLTYKPK